MSILIRSIDCIVLQKQKLQKLYKERDTAKVEQLLQMLTECADGANEENLLDLAIQVIRKENIQLCIEIILPQLIH